MSTNIYPGTCYRCGGHVPAGKGHYEKSRPRACDAKGVTLEKGALARQTGLKWLVQHYVCAIVFRGTDIVHGRNPLGSSPEDQALLAGIRALNVAAEAKNPKLPHLALGPISEELFKRWRRGETEALTDFTRWRSRAEQIEEAKRQRKAKARAHKAPRPRKPTPQTDVSTNGQTVDTLA